MNGNECGKKYGDEHLQATIPSMDYDRLTLILLKWRKWGAPNNASK